MICTHEFCYFSGLTYEDIVNKTFLPAQIPYNRVSYPLLSIHSEAYRLLLTCTNEFGENVWLYKLAPQVRKSGGRWQSDGFLRNKKGHLYFKKLPPEEELLKFIQKEFYLKYPVVHEGYYAFPKDVLEVLEMLSPDLTAKGLTNTKLMYHDVGPFKEDEVGYDEFDGEISIVCDDATLYIPYIRKSEPEFGGFILVPENKRIEFHDLAGRFHYWHRVYDEHFCGKGNKVIGSILAAIDHFLE